MSTIQLSGNLVAESFKFYEGTLDCNYYDITTNNFWIGNGSHIVKPSLSGVTITASSLLFWQGGAPFGSGNPDVAWTIDYKGDYGSGIVARYSLANCTSATTPIIAWHCNNYVNNSNFTFVGITGDWWYNMTEDSWYDLTDTNYTLFDNARGLSHSQTNSKTIAFTTTHTPNVDYGITNTGTIAFSTSNNNIADYVQSTNVTIAFSVGDTNYFNVGPSAIAMFVHGYQTTNQLAYLYINGMGSGLYSSLNLFLNPGWTAYGSETTLYIRSDGIYEGAVPIGSLAYLFIGAQNSPYLSLPMYVRAMEGSITGNMDLYVNGADLIYSGINLVLPSSTHTYHNDFQLYTFGYNE